MTSRTNGYVGKPVPAFESVTIAGEKVSSRDFGSKVLILTLWGVNCGSCLEEMTALEDIYREYRFDGLRIWAVNTEGGEADDIRNVMSIKKMKVSYDLVLDPDLKVTKLFTTWFIPVTVIVDSHGTVQYYKIGFNESDAQKIKAKVGALLAK